MTATAIAAVSAAGASLIPSTSSGDSVGVSITGNIVVVSVCLRHDNISFVLYRSIR